MQAPSGAVTCAMHMVDGLIHNKPNLLEVWDEGCLELYQELGQYSQLCHNIYERYWSSGNYDAPGVYDYEVSCEFGDWFGNYILEHEGRAPDTIDATYELESLAEYFFKRLEEFTDQRKEAYHDPTCI